MRTKTYAIRETDLSNGLARVGDGSTSFNEPTMTDTDSRRYRPDGMEGWHSLIVFGPGEREREGRGGNSMMREPSPGEVSCWRSNGG